MNPTLKGSDGSTVLGNTIPKPKRDSSAKNWCFTLNNYTEDELASIVTFLNLAPNNYVIGREVGEEGTPHLQGYVSFEKKLRMNECKNINHRIHWEVAKGNEKQNINYCTKDNKYIIKGFKVARPLKVIKEEQLYPWQKDILDIVKQEPDDRKIYWFWETKGCVGKTSFSKFLSHHYGAIPVDGKKGDILYCAATFESDIYIFDFERDVNQTSVSYASIEKIKNGYFMCAKYESKPVIRNPPHVIIMANFKPDTSKLSSDRWVINKLRRTSQGMRPIDKVDLSSSEED